MRIVARDHGRRGWIIMRDVIQKVIAAEAEGRRIVEAAKTEAERISSDAQKKAQDIVARARQEARAEAERMVEAAVHRSRT